ncbi:MAG: 4-alpha-glucanotransferase [Planctomycetaceae bacterium]|jgi:4-alpha-glucanotransferase|nr:4-alpha-glucanotransferase [Planctomycetaceae bacterium]
MDLKQRISGVLMPLSSLPGSSFCGDLGKGSRRFADFLSRSGQKVWQLLPVNPIDNCFSPYASVSTFAGDPIYIDLEDLVHAGLLEPEEIFSTPFAPKNKTVFHAAREIRMQHLKKAFERFRRLSVSTKYHTAFDKFVDENPWIGPHALFCALSEKFGTFDWTSWHDKALRHADQEALRRIYPELEESILFQTFLQLVFALQWDEFHDYCRNLGISLIGDIPIYVSKNSVDTWSDPRLFQLDEQGHMNRVAGVPADSFNPDGQRWNAPLYDWEAHKSENYAWWAFRIGNSLQRFDAIRLDHFIGFYNYFSMTPQPDPNDNGYWVSGPAYDFFDTILREFPNAQLIAEDLGVMNTGVHQLRDHYGFPGINVFQFHFDFRRNTDATAEWKENSLVCTGTHDTNTLAAWFDEVLADRKKTEPFWDLPFLMEMLKPFVPSGSTLNRRTVIEAIIRKVMSSRGNVAIFPMQDLLQLPTEARMNFPGHAEGNWVWRLDESLLTDELSQQLEHWTIEFNRNNCNNCNNCNS